MIVMQIGAEIKLSTLRFSFAHFYYVSQKIKPFKMNMASYLNLLYLSISISILACPRYDIPIVVHNEEGHLREYVILSIS